MLLAARTSFHSASWSLCTCLVKALVPCCGCKEDTPCRLRDAGSILRSCLARSGRNRRLKLRKVGPVSSDRKLQRRSLSSVIVGPGMRTAAAAWEALAKRSLALSLLLSDARRVARGVAAPGIAAAGCRCCSSSSRCCCCCGGGCCCCCYAVTLLLRASQQQKEVEWWSTSRDGSHRSGPLVWHNCVGSWYVWLTGWPTESRRKKNKKANL